MVVRQQSLMIWRNISSWASTNGVGTLTERGKRSIKYGTPPRGTICQQRPREEVGQHRGAPAGVAVPVVVGQRVAKAGELPAPSDGYGRHAHIWLSGAACQSPQTRKRKPVWRWCGRGKCVKVAGNRALQNEHGPVLAPGTQASNVAPCQRNPWYTVGRHVKQTGCFDTGQCWHVQGSCRCAVGLALAGVLPGRQQPSTTGMAGWPYARGL